MCQTINGEVYMKRKRYSTKQVLEKQEKVISRRFLFLACLIVGLFLVLLFRLYDMIYLKRDVFKEKLAQIADVVIEGSSAPRGRIYDRNYNLLVDNKAMKTIYYKKDKDITIEEELKLAYEVSKHLDLDVTKLTLRNFKEFWLAQNDEEAKKRITEEEWEKLEQRKLDQSDIENLKIDRITEDDLSIYQEEDKKAAYLYYLMNRGYTYDDKVIKTGNVTEEEYAYIAEHNQTLKGFNTKLDWERIYLYGDTFKTILGTVSDSNQGIPKELEKEYLKKGYSLNDRVGISYLEQQYEDILRGKKATYQMVNRYELTLKEEAQRGKDIVLTIDINLQQAVENILKEEIALAKTTPNTEFYNRSFVVVQDPNTGEILAMSGKQLLNKNGTDEMRDYTPGVVTSPMTVGSVVKGASILVGYNTGVIQIGEYQVDECIKIMSTPLKCSWKTLGRINDIQALAMSSNIYQFKIAMKVGGATYGYNQPLKIDPKAFQIYRDTYQQFGLGVKTGIDLPVESLGYKGTSTLPGHLLDFSMGQYDTYTPIQLSQYISTIANGGSRLRPHLLKEVHKATSGSDLGPVIEEVKPEVLNTVETEEKFLNRVKEGFHAVTMASYGIGHNYIDNQYDPSGKTGTSESFMDRDGDGVIDTETVSTAFVGYAPSEKPKMSIVVMSPDVNNPNGRSSYSSMVTRTISKRVSDKYFELYPLSN